MNIKSIYPVGVIALATLIIGMGCKKDLGNYNYTAVNSVLFSNIDTLNGYSINLGDTLRITPELSGTLDKSMTGSYKYEWMLRHSKPYYTDSVLSTSRNLVLQISLVPGTYPISFNVTDNNTGITWLKEIIVNVTTTYNEGWLVLSSVSDTARVDFLSYKNGTFTTVPNLLSKVNAGMPTQHDPSQIVFVNSTNGLVKPFNGALLVTASGTLRLDPTNFSYSNNSNIATTFLGEVPSGFKVGKMLLVKADQGPFYDNMMLYANGNVYQQAYGIFSSVPANTDPETGAPFNVSPYMAISGYSSYITVLYDEDSKRFVYMVKSGSFTNSTIRTIDPTLNFPSGKELLYMTDNNVPVSQGDNYAYAIMKDPGISKFYIARFSFTNAKILPVNYFEEVTGTDFDKAEHYAFSPDLGYLFYSEGGKLYEYDLFLKTSKLMLDLGTKKISMIAFDAGRTLDIWKNWLMVGSYDPAGPEGTNGTFTQYSVPPVNGSLTEKNKWTGFGKIVSFSYKYR